MNELEQLRKRISELEKSEIKLKQTEEELYLKNIVFNCSITANTIADLEGIITHVNASFLKMWGYENKDEVIGKPISNFFENEGELVPILDALNKIRVWEGEFVAKRKDGSNFISHGLDTAVVNEKGDLIGYQSANLDITESKRGEGALRESEERFRRLAENAPEIIYRFRILPDPGFEFISPAVTEIAGYTPQEYYDDPELGSQIIHPDDRSKLDELYKGIIPEGPHQVRWIRKDGKIIWTEDRATPIFNEKGEFIAIEGIAREITAQKEAEEALREAYDIINKNPAVPFLWKNEEGWPVEYVAENVADLFEYSAEEFISGKVRYSELVHPEDINRIENEVTKFSSEEGRDRFSHEPYRIVTKSGRIKWVEDKTYIRRDENNNLTHYQGIVEDITTRRLSELARLESEERFSKTFNSSPNPMIITEIESGKVIDMNNSFEKLIMYSKKEIIGKNVSDLNLWANSEDRENYIRKMKEDKRVSNLEIKIRTKPGDIRDSLISGEILTIQGKPYLLTSGIDITERKRIEEALIESKQMLSHVLNTIPVRVFWKDLNGVYLGCDQLFAMDAGRSNPEEVIGDNDYNMGWAEQAELYRSDDKFVIESGQPKINYEEPQTTPEGKTIWLRTSKIPLLNSTGNIYGVLGTYEDITERKLAEEALRDSERKFREMTDLLPQIVYETDLHGNLTFVNKQAYKSFGYSEDDLKNGFNVLQTIASEDRDRAQKNMLKIMNGKSIENTEYTLVKKDSSTFPALIYSSPVLKENKPVGLRGIIIDITERKQAENKIKESRQRLSSHMNNTPLGSIFWDIDFNVIEWNLSAEKIFGYSKEEALGKHPYKLIVPLEIQGQIDDVFNNLLTQTGGNRSVNENITKNGKRILCDWYNVAITDIDGKVTGVASLVDDITERTLTEKKLKNSRNQLRSLAERLQMIREEERATVAREIHDDLGQSLTALKMDISWLQKNPMDDIDRNTKLGTMLDLTDSIIQTVKRIASELRPGILDDLGLMSAIEWQKEEFEKRYNIKCNLKINKTNVSTSDEVSIAVFRIFQETLTNIARHSNATKVDIKFDVLMNKKLVMEIHDDGIGIDNKKVNSPNSLGLIGMRERVNILKGTMDITGKPSKGTTVKISIPI